MSRFLFEAPARLGLAKGWRMLERHTVPVLMLHGVLPEDEAEPFNSTGKFLSPRELEHCLERLLTTFDVMPMGVFLQGLLSRRRSDNEMLITFDDGYHNVYEHALPLLRRMGLPFSVFVTTGLIDSSTKLWTDRVEFALYSTRKRMLAPGVLPSERLLGTLEERRAAATLIKERLKQRPLEETDRAIASLFQQLEVDPADDRLRVVRFLSSQEIKEMAAAGVVFGGHSVTHPILSKESPPRVAAEVRECKRTIEEMTGQPVDCFAYPNGRREDFNAAVKHELVEAGYKAAFTTVHGLYAPGDDPYEIRRIAVASGLTCEELETRASGVLRVAHLLSGRRR